MNDHILHTEVQAYIFEKSNSNIDLTKLILSGSPFEAISAQEIAQQINGRYKAKTKLPLWYDTKGIYYPPTINLEQTSSALTASYKSELVSGTSLIDLTGGLGIDDYFFSQKIAKIIHCELNTELSKIANHNFKTLNATNIETRVGDGLEILKDFNRLDWIYIDPSRRHESKGKVFFLEDCLPDVPSNLDFLFSKSDHILMKTSPLLDINAGLKSLRFVKEIHVVAVQNEVKELLWVIEKDDTEDTIIKTINLQKDTRELFSFSLKGEKDNIANVSLPKRYLYEPNSAIMKSGGFYSLSKSYEAEKLHMHSHLYTSDNLIEFPGRRFEIIQSIPYHKKNMKAANITKANITTRNFPETVSQLRKRFKIKDGGDIYLFFTTNCSNEKIVLVCNKQ
ncbi:class I SAM-dependent methyltransferase [Aquimarina litoralis]|uniref:class I SAM-dependent methyltransferase n=1 Tax=Aquimarina litoralis TaxID=584605 RepID=UPI001C58275A|nr:class I SAM-dependent methyltransferase [Aquimarina litoralis]MBW1297187.1 class I SAM-dependent methyltransferase [Aquimarina litoralis]